MLTKSSGWTMRFLTSNPPVRHHPLLTIARVHPGEAEEADPVLELPESRIVGQLEFVASDLVSECGGHAVTVSCRGRDILREIPGNQAGEIVVFLVSVQDEVGNGQW
jgi:hypothetical protein